MPLDKYAKAIVAFLIALLGSLGTALTDGQITAVEWVSVLAAGLGALGLTWAVPNATGGTPK